MAQFAGDESRARAYWGQAAAADPSVELLHADGGWSAVVRVPARIAEEDLVMGLAALKAVVLQMLGGEFVDDAR